MRCPACGAEGAYVGLSTVECQSRTCRHAVADTPPVDDIHVRDLRVVGGRSSYEKIIAHIKARLASTESRVWRSPVFTEGPLDAAKVPEAVTITVAKYRPPTHFVVHRSHADRPPTVTTYVVTGFEANYGLPDDEDYR